MRVTIFGSTGRTGRLVVREGLRRGHEITAFTRRPHLLEPSTSGLGRVVEGDARDPVAVSEAVTGTEAVIAIIGAASRRGPFHAAEAGKVITRAMTDAGARRLVFTSAYPLVADRPRLPVWMLHRLLAASYADLAEMEQIVMSSELDWTIARLNRLTDKPPQGQLMVSRHLLRKPSALSRSDVALVLVDLVETDNYLRAAVNISRR